MIWGGTELWCIIILGSVPPLRPLFVKFVATNRFLSSSSHPSRRSGNSSGNSAGGAHARYLYGAKTARIMTDSTRSQLRSVSADDADREREREANGTKQSWLGRNRSADKMGNVVDWDDDERVLIMPKDGIVVQSTFEMVETRKADAGSKHEQGRGRDCKGGVEAMASESDPVSAVA